MPEPTNTVYSYYLPEVRPIIDEVAGNFPHLIYRQNYNPGLDQLHEPLMDAYTDFANLHGVKGFSHFPHSYYVNGSSEALFHLLAHTKSRPLLQLEGEYQGYNEYAKALRTQVQSVTPEMAMECEDCTFVISQPSAIDGCLLDDKLLSTIIANNYVILDLAYLGMTEPLALDLNHPNIIAVVGSMSKPFGLYYYRIGFCWAREPVPSLYGNKWFKNVFSILVGEQVLRKLDMAKVRDKYREWQRDAIEEVMLRGFEATPSDVWLLAHGGAPQSDNPIGTAKDLAPYHRGSGYRYCLTPYYIARERAEELTSGRRSLFSEHNAVARSIQERYS